MALERERMKRTSNPNLPSGWLVQFSRNPDRAIALFSIKSGIDAVATMAFGDNASALAEPIPKFIRADLRVRIVVETLLDWHDPHYYPDPNNLL